MDKYDKIFKQDNHIIMKTDNSELFDYSLTTLKEHGYDIKYISRDLHQENIFNIMILIII